LNEQGRNERLTFLEAGDTANYLHVDDGLFFTASDDPDGGDAVDVLMQRCAEALEEIGFVVPERRLSSDKRKKLVGYEFQESPPAITLTALRAHQLSTTLWWLTLAPKIDIELLRSVMGVWVWAALIARHWLAIPSSTFRMMDVCAYRRVPWWPSARAEVRVLARGVPALRRSLDSPVAPVLFSSDAEGANDRDCGGYGAVCAPANRELMIKILHGGLRPGRTIARLDGTVAGLHDPLKEMIARIGVSHVPAEADSLPWSPVLYGRWKWQEHITLGEGRVTLKLLEVLAGLASCHSHICPTLVDNEPWAAACAKGRSPSRPLVLLLRRRLALLTAAQIDMPLPWINTKRQAADALSRWVPG